MSRSEENWALACSVELTPSRHELRPGHEGVVVAEAHPTGWFICALYDPDLAPAEVNDFAHFVQVRTYLLLDQGPRRGSWELGNDRVWRTHYRASIAELLSDLTRTA